MNILVTGANGFIATHITKQLLARGHWVRGTVRSLAKGASALRSLPGASERLELVEAELLRQGAYDRACQDIEVVLHTASPYVLDAKDPQRDLVDPALQGTRNVLGAAAKSGTVRRVVVTSSMAAVTDEPDGDHVLTENDWNERSSLERNPYYYSKTVAERAAWDFVANERPGFDLVAIQPFLVIGPSLSEGVNTSNQLFVDLLKGVYPGIMNLTWGFVDVRDVADAHVRAAEHRAANGRYLCAGDTIGMRALVEVLEANGWGAGNKLPKLGMDCGVGDFAVRLSSYLQPKGVGTYLRTHVGRVPRYDTRKIREDLPSDGGERPRHARRPRAAGARRASGVTATSRVAVTPDGIVPASVTRPQDQNRRVRPVPGSVAAPVAGSMVLAAAERGLNPAPLLSQMGLDRRTVFEPERRVSFASLYAVWADCMRAIRDPGLPIEAAKRVRLEDYAVLGFATTSAPTFGEALALLARYGTLHADGCRWEIAEDDSLPGVCLRWVRDGVRSLGHRVANECAIAEALHAARQILAFRLVPQAVAFRHAAPASIRTHEEFFGRRPRFGASWEGLAFAREALALVPSRANPPLTSWLERQMSTRVEAQTVPTTLGERVRQRLEQDLSSGAPSLAHTARALALSERTLRRQLRDEKLSFRELAESVRRKRAESLLAAGDVSIDEVAFLAGFSETSAFARAFKRWSGTTPGAFRASAARSRDRLGQEGGRAGQGT